MFGVIMACKLVCFASTTDSGRRRSPRVATLLHSGLRCSLYLMEWFVPKAGSANMTLTAKTERLCGFVHVQSPAVGFKRDEEVSKPK